MKKTFSAFRSVCAAALAATLLASALFINSCGKEHVHKWGEWELYIEPTCYIAGQERSVCSCGASKFRSIDVSHQYGEPENDVAAKKKVSVCSICGSKREEELTSGDVGIALITVAGNPSEKSAQFDVSYDGAGEPFSDKATVFVIANDDGAKGKSSYSVKLSSPRCLNDGWKEYSEYVLDASDPYLSKSANAVSSALYRSVVLSSGKSDAVNSAFSAGAKDGVPVCLYIGNDFKGIYMLSVPYTAESLGMNGEGSQAIMRESAYSEQTALASPLSGDPSADLIEINYTSTEDALWAAESFNAMTEFVRNTNGAAFREGIGQYIDVDRAIDEMLFVYASGAVGNVSDKTVWATYDGTVWIPLAGDMTGAFGVARAEGEEVVPGEALVSDRASVLWQKLNLYFADELGTRWEALRNGPLSLASVQDAFGSYLSDTPDFVADADENVNKGALGANEAYAKKIGEYASASLYYLDVHFGVQ